jgi:hypothetical protein
MLVLRLAGLALLLAAAFGSFGWLVDYDTRTVLGLIALGLACLVASGIGLTRSQGPT